MVFMVRKALGPIKMIHENINKVWQNRALYDYHRCTTHSHKFHFIPRCVTCLRHERRHVSSFYSWTKAFCEHEYRENFPISVHHPVKAVKVSWSLTQGLYLHFLINRTEKITDVIQKPMCKFSLGWGKMFIGNDEKLCVFDNSSIRRDLRGYTFRRRIGVVLKVTSSASKYLIKCASWKWKNFVASNRNANSNSLCFPSPQCRLNRLYLLHPLVKHLLH